jgi:hypothetical protein
MSKKKFLNKKKNLGIFRENFRLFCNFIAGSEYGLNGYSFKLFNFN